MRRKKKAGDLPDPSFTIDLTDELDDDWLRPKRLKQKALKGNQSTQAELDRMESTKLTKMKDD